MRERVAAVFAVMMLIGYGVWWACELPLKSDRGHPLGSLPHAGHVTRPVILMQEPLRRIQA